jgi:hypothetical protein
MLAEFRTPQLYSFKPRIIRNNPKIMQASSWALLVLLLLLLYRIQHVLKNGSKTNKRSRVKSDICSTAIFLGSGPHISSVLVLLKPLATGGHTTEMLALISSLDFERYCPRLYVTSEGDIFSAQKATDFELAHSVTFMQLCPLNLL